MKTINEWSNAFDVLVADYIRVNQFGYTSPILFDEYEKSLFLTSSLEEVLKELYSGNTTFFEDTEEIRRYLDSLIITKDCNSVELELSDVQPLIDIYTHTLYNLPLDCWFIVFESIQNASTDKCLKDKVLKVIPITHDEYSRVKDNPFRGPNGRKVLRLDAGNKIIEIVSGMPIKNYKIRYIKQPKPIILINLENDDLSINGYKEISLCELNESIHHLILERAVKKALSTRTTNNAS